MILNMHLQIFMQSINIDINLLLLIRYRNIWQL